MNRTASTLFMASVLIFLSPLCGHSQYYEGENFKEGSGLPSSESYMVFQDRKGFIWIGTDNGIVRYDGNEFRTYSIKTGLSDNTVFGFYEDQFDRIWFRTYSGALSYFTRDTIEHYKFNDVLMKNLSESILLSIYPDSLGNLYFSTNLYSKIGKIDSTGKVEILNSKEEANFIRFVDGRTLVGSSGIPRYTESIQINNKKFPIRLDDSYGQTNTLLIAVWWNNKLYFSIHKNLFYYDGENVIKVLTTDQPFISLYVDREGLLWTGFFNGGLKVFDDEQFKEVFRISALDGSSVSGILQDRESGVWVSTLDKGVFHFPNLMVSNYDLPNQGKISAACNDENFLFIGNYDGEVFRVDKNGSIEMISRFAPPISDLFIDDSGQLWISDATGTFVNREDHQRSERFPTAYRGLIQNGAGLLAYNSMGVFKLDPKGIIVEKLLLRKRPTSMIAFDSVIFLGGLHGLERLSTDFNKKGKQITEARISSLFDLDHNLVLVGTTGQGLFLYNNLKNQLLAIHIPDVSNIYSITGSWKSKRLWVGTESGLFQMDFDVSTEGEIFGLSIRKANGLVASKINYAASIGVNVWTISDLGLSRVPKSLFNAAQPSPNIYIRQILVNNKPQRGDMTSLSVHHENMVIDVQSIHFQGQPVHFRYRLGTTYHWNEISGQSIFLSGLIPDSYHMEIQGSIDGANWSESLPLDIEVRKEWYETWLFRIVVTMLVGLMAFFLYLVRINRIRQKHKYLELVNTHQQRLIDSEILTQERERKRIAEDLHDGVGTSLSSIKLMVSDSINAGLEERSNRTHEINDYLTDVIAEIKRIVYDLHPPALERYGLQVTLKNLADKINQVGGISIILNYYGESVVAAQVSLPIYRIIQELINNTIKHARASEIRIHVNQFEDEINIMYEDNGIGMMGSRFSGLGLHSVESRVRSLKGRMSWESNHRGTFYNFDIPC